MLCRCKFSRNEKFSGDATDLLVEEKTEAPRGAGVVKLTTAAKWVLQESGVGPANCNK